MSGTHLNVLGISLISCSHVPLTGCHRDGCCNTGDKDQYSHVIYAKVTQDFLDSSFQQGIDLIRHHLNIGLKAYKLAIYGVAAFSPKTDRS